MILASIVQKEEPNVSTQKTIAQVFLKDLEREYRWGLILPSSMQRHNLVILIHRTQILRTIQEKL
ncbi:hypothetical protein H6801_01065 [Candidatus Nomurabacteria bacterium]|nr:hypothetical protein [Candidatus Nomurabacteria bacterium]